MNPHQPLNKKLLSPPEIQITRELRFEAAHYLHNPAWSRKKNLSIFKKCSGYRLENPKIAHQPHGHSYRLKVTILGKIDAQTGFVMDFQDFKEILNQKIYKCFDHRLINHEVEPFKSHPYLQTTVENLLIVIWNYLESDFQKFNVQLYELTLWETAANSGTYRGNRT